MEKRIPIWGKTIPGNRPESKRDVMDWHEEYTQEDLFMKYPGIWDKSTPEIGDLSGNDTMVYRQEIQTGLAKETYEDVPFLIPYLKEGSDRCVIICPGGAYLTKSMDSEGEHIAQFLNEAGVSAFVLWYRSYPNRAPLMYLDCQRAIRYVRFHADEFGIDPGKIGIVGFSAGGNLCGVTALVFRNEPVEWEGYTPDEVDAVNGCVNALGMVYPAISMANDKIVAVIGGREIYEDPAQRQAFSDRYEMRTHVQEGDCPMFLCACWDDDVVDPYLDAELAMIASKKGVKTELHLFPYGGHGFGGCIHEQMPMFMQDWSAVKEWKGLFADWINRTFQ